MTIRNTKTGKPDKKPDPSPGIFFSIKVAEVKGRFDGTIKFIIFRAKLL